MPTILRQPALLDKPAVAPTGFSDTSAGYRFAMGYGASLMLGWTALLVWASLRPMERRFVAVLTMLVVLGLVLTEVVVVCSGTIGVGRMAPTWCLQAGLLLLFGCAYH